MLYFIYQHVLCVNTAEDKELKVKNMKKEGVINKNGDCALRQDVNSSLCDDFKVHKVKGVFN